MNRLELNLTVLTLSLVLAACSGSNPSVLPPATPPPATPSPTLSSFAAAINPPVDVGEPTPNRVAGDITFELTFPEGTDIESLPEIVTVAGAEFRRQLPSARQGVVIVLYVAVDPAQPLDTKQLIVFSLPGVFIEFSVLVRFSTSPSPTPTVSPTAEPTTEPTAAPTAEPSPGVTPPLDPPIDLGPPSDPPPPPAPTLSNVVNSTSDATADTNDPANCTLREAIQAVNNTPTNIFGGCEITGGTIQFANSLSGQIDLSAQLPEITRSVVITGPGASVLTISGGNTHRIFKIAATNNPVVTIEKLTLTEGRATNANGGAIWSTSMGLLTINSATISNSTATKDGGGIFAYNGSTSVRDSTLSGNSAGKNGGGIFTYYGSISVSDNSTLSGNEAGMNGGGLFTNNVSISVSDSTLSGNEAGMNGGGIRANMTATVTNSTLSGNKAVGANSDGGAIYAAATADVLTSTLSSNSANSRGGGIRANTVTVSNSTLNGNSANLGGGIYANNRVTVNNSTLSANSAGSQGGGIRSEQVTIVRNSTIVLNRASFGGGIRGTTSNTFEIDNTIIAGNSDATGTAQDIDANVSSGSNNLIGAGGSGNLTNGFKGNIVDGSLTNTNLGSVLNVTLADNGGPTKTHALVANSPAIDAGDDSLIPSGIMTDQRGLLRTVDGNGNGTATVDIGAYEAQSVIGTPPPSLVVNTTTDDDGTNLSNCSLREAITASNNQAAFGGCAIPPSSTIEFAATVSGQIDLSAQLPEITRSVVITGPGAKVLTISGGNTHRIFKIASTNNPVVTIEKLTLTEGRATNANGGAILSASTGLLTVNQATISQNTAEGSISSGGGIWARSLKLSNSILSGNSVGADGGALYILGPAAINNSTISGNTARSEGGGIRMSAGSILNSTIVLNKSGQFSDGIRSLSPIVVNNSIVLGNKSIFNDAINNFSLLDEVTPESGNNITFTPEAGKYTGGLSDGVNGNIILASNDAAAVIDVVLKDNDGPTFTHALAPGSRALGAGDLGICAADPINNRDQRGEMRPQGDAACDIGAFESDLLAPTP